MNKSKGLKMYSYYIIMEDNDNKTNKIIRYCSKLKWIICDEILLFVLVSSYGCRRNAL